MSATVTLEPWGSGDLLLLERLIGDPRMTEHLGGPESLDKLRERQARYERLDGGDRMFKIVAVAGGAGVGSVGFWTKEWRDEQVYEVGWMVVPEFQGRGFAVAATAQAIELAKGDDEHRFMHAFPNVDNAPSNAICRKLGFELLEECEFEFPKGHFMTCNDWRLDLRAELSAIRSEPRLKWTRPEIASGDGGSAPGSVVAVLGFEATLRSDTRRRVYLPLPGEPEVRHLAGTVGGMRYRGAVESIDGSPALVLGPAWRRDCGLKAGDRVRVELEPEGPQRQDLAPDLAAALDASAAAAAFWDELAQFYRRAYLRWIDATKRSPALRAERIAVVVALLERRVKARP